MRRKFLVAAVFLLCFPGLSHGQSGRNESSPAAMQEPGYATGHVVCDDTQRPARLARVRFVPVPTAAIASRGTSAPKSKMNGLETNQLFGSEINPVETDMDGRFTARELKPGRYVVRVDLNGYVTPLLGFSPADFEHPDEATRERMTRELNVVTIAPRTETRVDVTLQRGATIAGAVRFDDGTPAIAIATELLTKNAKGEWESSNRLGYRFGATDSQGRYLVEGVPPGEYLVRANLSLSEYSNSVMPVNGTEVHMQMTKTIFSLPVYTGSVLRTREAKPIKVDGAGMYDGNDIALPISKLHHISGALVAADGHPLNAGKVTLRNADDDSEVANVSVSREDRQFQFPYVPEGSYTLAVDAARDVTEIEVPNPPGMMPRFHPEDKTLRQYGTVKQPLLVQSDVDGVIVTLPAPSKSASWPSATQ